MPNNTFNTFNFLRRLLTASFFLASFLTHPFFLPSAQAQLLLNEIYASPTSGEPEWLEIYNPSDVPVSLTAWQVAEKINEVIKNHEPISLASEATLAAHSHFLLAPNKITLNNAGDSIYLFNPAGEIADQITYPKLTNLQSYARTPDGAATWQITTPSPLAPNPAAPADSTTTPSAVTTTSTNPTIIITTPSQPTPTPTPTPSPTSAPLPPTPPPSSWRDQTFFSLPRSSSLPPSTTTSASHAAFLNPRSPTPTISLASPKQTHPPLFFLSLTAIILGLLALTLIELASLLQPIPYETPSPHL